MTVLPEFTGPEYEARRTAAAERVFNILAPQMTFVPTAETFTELHKFSVKAFAYIFDSSVRRRQAEAADCAPDVDIRELVTTPTGSNLDRAAQLLLTFVLLKRDAPLPTDTVSFEDRHKQHRDVRLTAFPVTIRDVEGMPADDVVDVEIIRLQDPNAGLTTYSIHDLGTYLGKPEGD